MSIGTESIDLLRRSLTDLDAELAAGDLSPADHARLRDEYTARLAAALRGQPDVFAAAGRPVARPGRRTGKGRAVAAALAVLVFAVGAGVAVARASGSRAPGQSITGDLQGPARARLDSCLQLSATSALEAVKCYDGVLVDEPSSVEALSYRAWTLVRLHDERLWPEAARNLDAAVLADPAYPDARVFRMVLYRDMGRLDEARVDLAAFDRLAAPQLMRDLVDQMGLRASLS